MQRAVRKIPKQKPWAATQKGVLPTNKKKGAIVLGDWRVSVKDRKGPLVQGRLHPRRKKTANKVRRAHGQATGQRRRPGMWTRSGQGQAPRPSNNAKDTERGTSSRKRVTHP